jgi:hypothetical protein
VAFWQVVPLDAAREPEYEALVSAAPASPLTHTLLWRDALLALGLGQPLYFLALRDGRLRAALPAFVHRSGMGAVLNSLPFVQSTGGVITAAEASPSERTECMVLLLEAMRGHCRSAGIDVACVVGSPYRGPGDSADADLARPPDFQMVRKTRVLDLQAPFQPRPSIVWTVRKADRLGPRHRVAETAAEARAVYDLYAASMQRLGVAAHPWLLFESLFVRSGPARGVRFVWAEVDGAPVSGLILLVHNQVVDYYCVGNDQVGRRLQMSSWLCQREMERAREGGVRWWNWGVSPSPAVHDFKKRWGGADASYAISGFCLGDVSPWKGLTPSQLMAEFPSYFVIPYDWLTASDQRGLP